jgi:hypothetical protein
MSNVEVRDVWEDEVSVTEEISEKVQTSEEFMQPDVGETMKAFMSAISSNDLDTVRFMIKSGQVNPNNIKSETLLHYAAKKLNEPLALLAIEFGVDPNSKNWKGAVPYHYALLESQLQATSLVQMLHDKTNPQLRKLIPQEVLTAKLMKYAATEALFPVVKALIEEYNADVNAVKGIYKKTVLMKACRRNNIQLVKYLLEKNANVNAKTNPKKK